VVLAAVEAVVFAGCEPGAGFVAVAGALAGAPAGEGAGVLAGWTAASDLLLLDDFAGAAAFEALG
jgi:hypothetical protein